VQRPVVPERLSAVGGGGGGSDRRMAGLLRRLFLHFCGRPDDLGSTVPVATNRSPLAEGSKALQKLPKQCRIARGPMVRIHLPPHGEGGGGVSAATVEARLDYAAPRAVPVILGSRKRHVDYGPSQRLRQCNFIRSPRTRSLTSHEF